MIQHAFIYLFSGVLNRLTPFLLLPVLTRVLSPADFGLLSLYQVSLTFGIAICGFNLHINVVKSYPSMQREQFGRMSFNVCVILCLSSILVLFLMSIALLVNPSLFDIPHFWLISLPIVACFSVLTMINQSVLRSAGRAWTYAGFEISATALNLILSIVLVVGFSLGWQGRAAGIAIAALVAGALALASLVRNQWIVPNWNGREIRNLLFFTLPFLPHTIASSVLGVSDRFFLENMVGKSELGLYSVAYNFGMVVMLFTDSFAKAWTPYFLREMHEESGKKRIKRSLIIYVITLTIGTVIYSTLSVVMVPYLVGAEYAKCIEYIPFICLGYLFFGLYQIVFPYLVFHGKSMAVGFTSTVAAVTNLIGNYFFILYYGAMGAAFSTVLGFFVSFVLVGSLAYYFEAKSIDKASTGSMALS